MQNLTSSTRVEGENMDVNMKSSSCHASSAPAKLNLSEPSHDVKTPQVDAKKQTYLVFKENGNMKPNEVIKLVLKPQTPACIKACDVSSLLDQFLEYEQSQSKCVTLVKCSSVSLTPSASPSHVNKPNFTGLGCDAKPATSPPSGLTPPVSPPLQNPVANARSPCMISKATTTSETLHSSTNTPVFATPITPSNDIPGFPSNIGTTKRDICAWKSNKATEDKLKNSDGSVVSIKTETKLDIKQLAAGKEVLNKPELPTVMQSKHRASISNPSSRKVDKVDRSHERKREYSIDEDEENDYCDFKRKKYIKDECYWTTSEEESDDDKGRHHRAKRKSKSYHNSKRENCHNCNSDSDNNNTRQTKTNRQRRPDRSPRRRRRSHADDSGSEEDSHHKHHTHHHHRRQETKSPQKEKAEENVHLYDIENERKKNFKLDRSIKQSSTEKRKIVYIGNIESSMSKSDIWKIFRKFGPIEKTTVHYRDDGDNYAFVTFVDSSSALDAIEEGKKDPKLKHLDICFGGRRKFCGGSYVDFDSTTSSLEEQQEREGSRKTSYSNGGMDFDALLQMCLKKSKR